MTRTTTPARPSAADAIMANHRAHDRESLAYWEARAERIRDAATMIARDRITIGRHHRTIADWSGDEG